MISTKCLTCYSSMVASLDNVYDTRFGIENSYIIGKCEKCGIEQTIPALVSEELKILYEKYYDYGGDKGTSYIDFRERFLLSSLYQLWLVLDGDISFHKIRGNGRLIDIGCNEGRGLRFYQRNGFVAEGLELNEAAATVARNQGFTVHTKLLEQFQPTTDYEVAVLSNVLEHSLDSKGMLSHARRILRTEGQIWISCPNNQSWLRLLFGRYWINWHVPFHIVHFSPITLRSLLESVGFKVIQMRQETTALWVAHSVIAWLFAKRDKPTRQLRNPMTVAFLMLFIRGFLFPFLWLGNFCGRGDCLVVIAKKV